MRIAFSARPYREPAELTGGCHASARYRGHGADNFVMGQTLALAGIIAGTVVVIGIVVIVARSVGSKDPGQSVVRSWFALTLVGLVLSALKFRGRQWCGKGLATTEGFNREKRLICGGYPRPTVSTAR